MRHFLLGRTLSLQNYILITLFYGLLISTKVIATPPLYDQIEIEGKSVGFFQKGETWLPQPRNKALITMGREERCSTIGGPVGKWKINRNKIYLTGFYKCGGSVELGEIYSGADSPILATWLFGDFFYNHGKTICHTGFFETVSEFRTTMRIKNGKIQSSQTEPNEGVYITIINPNNTYPECKFIPQ